ncbi:hypothetical protein SISNIDRAFT_466723 [Sistotremastrum niveocremeum HHB9708]|uniref:Fungal N-terminal domain-containing protein n=1 Tax=Sistotremastrum niveocremeum HHB9708 TaxID=1314777 RepID=A0A164U2N5_9AGAM|nr:hypothetical protein SISNIDRAFT_466723 [Sistotremastrum niveocremeum HHB9708]
MPSWTTTLTLATLATSLGSQVFKLLEWFNQPRSQRTVLSLDSELRHLEQSLYHEEARLLDAIRLGWIAGPCVQGKLDCCRLSRVRSELATLKQIRTYLYRFRVELLHYQTFPNHSAAKEEEYLRLAQQAASLTHMALTPNAELTLTQYIDELGTLVQSCNPTLGDEHHPFMTAGHVEDNLGDVLLELGLVCRPIGPPSPHCFRSLDVLSQIRNHPASDPTSPSKHLIRWQSYKCSTVLDSLPFARTGMDSSVNSDHTVSRRHLAARKRARDERTIKALRFEPYPGRPSRGVEESTDDVDRRRPSRNAVQSHGSNFVPPTPDPSYLGGMDAIEVVSPQATLPTPVASRADLINGFGPTNDAEASSGAEILHGTGLSINAVDVQGTVNDGNMANGKDIVWSGNHALQNMTDAHVRRDHLHSMNLAPPDWAPQTNAADVAPSETHVPSSVMPPSPNAHPHTSRNNVPQPTERDQAMDQDDGADGHSRSGSSDTDSDADDEADLDDLENVSMKALLAELVKSSRRTNTAVRRNTKALSDTNTKLLSLGNQFKDQMKIRSHYVDQDEDGVDRPIKLRPKHKSGHILLLMKRIRTFLAAMEHRPAEDDSAPTSLHFPLPSAEVLAAFDDKRHSESYTFALVQTRAREHLRGRRKTWLLLEKQLSDAQLALLKAKARANSRRIGLYWRRMHIAQKEHGLKPMIKILGRLGTNGMSSDESDGGPHRYTTHSHHETYRIRLRIDRPQWLTDLLRMLDALHYERRETSSRNGGKTQGNRTRLRLQCDRISQALPVPGLPENYYDVIWLQALTPEQRYDLFIKEADPFELPPQYLMYIPHRG